MYIDKIEYWHEVVLFSSNSNKIKATHTILHITSDTVYRTKGNN